MLGDEDDSHVAMWPAAARRLGRALQLRRDDDGDHVVPVESLDVEADDRDPGSADLIEMGVVGYQPGEG